MKKEFVRMMVFCAACLALGAQAQSSTDGSSSTTPGSSSSSSTTRTYQGASGSVTNSQFGQSGKYSASGGLSATGRSGQNAIPASQLNSSQIKSSSGEALGTISDIIINPSSGRVEFAVLSLSAGTGSSASTSSSTTSSDASSSSKFGNSASSGSGKQIVVPWNLLRASGSGSEYAGGTSSSSSSSTMSHSFVFTGDQSKLQSAPSFDVNSSLSQPGWRQSVNSYFGSSAGATGGATSPGGSSSSTGSSDSSSATKDTSTTPDSSSSSANPKR